MDTLGPLYRYFLGHWSLQRRFLYERGGATGRMVGSAMFAPWFGTTLLYTEKGTLRLDGGQRLDTFQRYAYACCRREVTLHFVTDRQRRTLRPFCTLRFEPSDTARAEHACQQDHYRGRFELVSPSGYHTLWRVCGPTKRGYIETNYTHQCAG